METLLSISPLPKIKSLKQATEDQAVRYARTCYDHLAGNLGVKLTQALVNMDFLNEDSDGFHVTNNGEEFFKTFQVDYESVKKKRRAFTHKCLDWSERRHHLGGALGNALLERLFDLNWIQRIPNTRAIKITHEGSKGFKETFLIEI
jgi:hypothetical protein